jgi:hypothetical protein
MILGLFGGGAIMDGSSILLGKQGFSLRDDRLALASLLSFSFLLTVFLIDRPKRWKAAVLLAILPVNPLWRLVVVVPIAIHDFGTAMGYVFTFMKRSRLG